MIILTFFDLISAVNDTILLLVFLHVEIATFSDFFHYLNIFNLIFVIVCSLTNPSLWVLNYCDLIFESQ